MNGPNCCPTVSAPSPALASTSDVDSTAVLPLAVTEDVAPAVPTPEKMRTFHVNVTVAVGLVTPFEAVSVNVVVVTVECVNEPDSVAEVNGALSA